MASSAKLTGGTPVSLLARILTIALAIATSVAHADYRVEFDGSYAETDADGFDVENVNLAVEVFLRPVDDSKGPLGEAAFLDRASSARYQFDRSEEDFGNNAQFGASDIDPTKAHQLRLRYVAEQSGWIFSGLAERTPSRQSTQGEEQGYRLGAGFGRYLNVSTSLEFNLGYANSDIDSAGSQPCPFTFIEPTCDLLLIESESTTEVWSGDLRLRRVGKIGRATFATTLVAGYSRLDFDADVAQRFVDVNGEELPLDFGLFAITQAPSLDRWNALAAGTWFINRYVGLDLDYSYSKVGDFDVHAVGTGIGWFLSPNVELRGSFTKFFPDLGANNDQWRATLRARF